MSKSLAILALCFGACAEPQSLEVVAHGPASTITVDQASYTPGQTIVTSWTGLPGNANDWIAIAPAGSPATTVTSWAYTGGAASGMRNFTAPSTGGNYVARSFVDDSYNMSAESTTFAITASSTTTNKTSYTLGEPVVVSWTGLPGTAGDWVAIAPAGSDPQTIKFWVYTGGTASGMTSFANVGVGTWVARTYLDNSYVVLGTSADFTVGVPTGGTVTTDKTTYLFGEFVTVSWADVPPGNQHWVAIAAPGSPLGNVMRWAYTNGQASGSKVFDVGMPTSPLLARLFLNDQYILADESDPFSFGTTVTTNKSSYFGSEAITVTVGTLPSFASLELQATDGTPVPNTGVAIGSNQSHTYQFGISTPGTYVAKVGTFGTSAPFTVAGNPIVFTTNVTQYQISPFGMVPVSWLNLPSGPPRWIAVAPLGSPDTTVVRWKYIDDSANGSDYVLGPVSPGTYVIRAFINDSYQKIAETTSFTAQ